eukprot:446855-Prorocentrum_minimum.AAC.1
MSYEQEPLTRPRVRSATSTGRVDTETRCCAAARSGLAGVPWLQYRGSLAQLLGFPGSISWVPWLPQVDVWAR